MDRHFFSLCALVGLSGCIRLMPAPPEIEDGEPCSVSSACKPGSLCQFDANRAESICFKQGGCLLHEDCALGAACYAGSCAPIQCGPGAGVVACGPYACNEAARRCESSCRVDGDCAAGHVCRDGACVNGTCTAETAAVVCRGAACDAALGTCLSEYDCDEVGCASGYSCDYRGCNKRCGSDEHCERYTCTSSGECRDRCSWDQDCQAGYECRNSFCQLEP